MSKASEAAIEIGAHLGTVAPVHEGLRDYSRLVLKGDAPQAISQALREYDERKKLADAAKTAIDALIADGYPSLPKFALPPDVMAELREQSTTIAAALAQAFEADQAGTLGMTADPPVLK